MKVFARMFCMILAVGNVMTAVLPGRTKVELSKVLQMFFYSYKTLQNIFFIQ